MRLTVARFPKLTFKKWVKLARKSTISRWNEHDVSISVLFTTDTTRTFMQIRKLCMIVTSRVRNINVLSKLRLCQ